ncbi:MAG: serine protease Do [Thermoanaerobaculia bacterium]|jgi:S1-C subfamily serine protease|nr:serine protease Do [Thermoanaerobaculia bacterium]
MASHKTGHAAAFLFLLFFTGFGVTLFAFVDLRWTHWIMTDSGARALSTSKVDQAQLQRLRQSIVNVRAQCTGGEQTGTGFVVKPGYLATAAHILGDRQRCSGPLRLVDYKGLEHTATVEGVSADDDLALLRIGDTSLPPLQLADAAKYEASNEVVRLVTIGYPLEDQGASARDSASVSGEGSLSRFIRDRNVFVTSGLNLNPGNSGGPIFVRDNWTVLGIVRAKLPNTAGDGIGYVASIRTFESFFREKTGQALR